MTQALNAGFYGYEIANGLAEGYVVSESRQPDIIWGIRKSGVRSNGPG